jgi:hypothetical protein
LAAKKRNVSLIPQQDGHARSKKSIINLDEDNDEYPHKRARVTVESDEEELHRSRKFIHRKDLKEATKGANRLEKEHRKRLEVDAEVDASGELQISLRKDSMLYLF